MADSKVKAVVSHSQTIDGKKHKAGDQVSAGQYIADVGTDGYSSGPHLHFEVHPNGGVVVNGYAHGGRRRTAAPMPFIPS